MLFFHRAVFLLIEEGYEAEQGVLQASLGQGFKGRCLVYVGRGLAAGECWVWEGSCRRCCSGRVLLGWLSFA